MSLELNSAKEKSISNSENRSFETYHANFRNAKRRIALGASGVRTSRRDARIWNALLSLSVHRAVNARFRFASNRLFAFHRAVKMWKRGKQKELPSYIPANLCKHRRIRASYTCSFESKHEREKTECYTLRCLISFRRLSQNYRMFFSHRRFWFSFPRKVSSYSLPKVRIFQWFPSFKSI